MQKKLFEEIKKTIVFIGSLLKDQDQQIKSILLGTGFLIQIDNYFHLVTAKHVVAELDNSSGVIQGKNNLFVFNNLKSGQVRYSSLDEIKTKYQYFYSKNPLVDLAIVPFPLDVNSDVKVFAKDMFLKIENVYETNEVFYLSYQPNISEIEKNGKVYPITRKGMISKLNQDRSFYIDGSAFPGNSGSPVFMYPSAIRVTDDGNITFGGDKFGGKFLGIIGNYLPYQDIAFSKQTGRPRVVFEENTGLSQVWSVDHILEIVETDEFKKHLKKLQGANDTK